MIWNNLVKVCKGYRAEEIKIHPEIPRKSNKDLENLVQRELGKSKENSKGPKRYLKPHKEKTLKAPKGYLENPKRQGR